MKLTTPTGKPIQHGTVNAYSNYACRCKRCRKAWADAMRERRRKQRAKREAKRDGYNLYWLYDKDETLLYIGLSCQPGERLKAHKRKGLAVARMDVIRVPNYLDGRAKERHLIRLERPPFNKGDFNGCWCDECRRIVLDKDNTKAREMRRKGRASGPRAEREMT